MLEVVADGDRRAHQRVELELVGPWPAATENRAADLALPMGLPRLAGADGEALAIARSHPRMRERHVLAAAVELDAQIFDAIDRLHRERRLAAHRNVVLQLKADGVAEQQP